MKLKLDEKLEQSLERLIARTEKPSFDNNKGLTKIKRFILLDSIDFIKNLLEDQKRKNSINS